MENKSAQAKDFVEVMKEIHQQVQDWLKDSSIKYKEQVDKKGENYSSKWGTR